MRFSIVAEQIPAVADTPYPLGRNLYHDSRSRMFPYLSTLAPKPVKHECRIGTLNQGNLGSCVANATLYCLGTEPFFSLLNGHNPWGWDEAAAVQLYSLLTERDVFSGSFPPDDTGSNGLASGQELVADGVIPGYLHAFTIADGLSALAEQPIIAGMNWYPSMFTPDNYGIIRVGANEQPVGGHELCFDELTVSGLLGFHQSWDGWGIDGRGYMEISTFTRLMNEGGDMTVFVLPTLPPPIPLDPPIVLSDVDRLALDLAPWLAAKNARTGVTRARQIVRRFLESRV